MKTFYKSIFLKLSIATLVVKVVGVQFLIAQTITIKSYGIEEGLSDVSVRDVHTDKFGYKWISTGHGLNKYDGINFEKFRYDPRDSLSIRANSLNRLFEDPTGNIWVTVDIGGMSMLNRASRQFHYFNYSSSKPNHSNNFVTDVLFDHKGRAWVGTRFGINLVNRSTHKYELVEVTGQREMSVIRVFEDQNNSIWLSTNTGLFKYDEIKSSFQEIKNSYNQSIININKFLNDTEGNLWVASLKNGIYFFLKGSSSPKNMPHPSGDEGFVSNLVQSKNSNVILSVPREGLFEWRDNGWIKFSIEGVESQNFRYAYTSSSNEYIFLLTYANEVGLYDPKKSIVNWVPSFSKPINAFSVDSDDANLWLGTANFGLYQVSLTTSEFETIIVKDHSESDQNYSNFIIDLLATNAGETYFVAGPGLFQIDQITQEVTHVIDYWRPGDFNIGITGIKEFDDDNLLLSTNKGIFKFNKHSKKTEQIVNLNERIAEVAMHANQIWGIGDFGLFNHDLGKDSTTLFIDIEDAPEELQTNLPRKLFIDSEGVVWIGTVREGLFRVEETKSGYLFDRYRYKGIRNSGLISHTINALFEGSGGQLWVGGFSTGLLQFDRKKKAFINYTPGRELPIPNIQAIEEANDGCLWLSAANGLHKFIPGENIFKKYTSKNGLSSNSFVLRSSTMTPDGKILFGSNIGITAFYPSLITSPTHLPKVLIEEVSIFNKRIESEISPYALQEIELKHNQNFLSFSFIGIDYTNASQITYSYQLEGLTDDWINLGNTRNISFNNLNPGDYTLKIRASINEDFWGESVTLDFNIDAPFWLKSWFFGLLALVSCSILWLTHKYRLYQKLGRLKVREEIRQKAAADFHDEMGNKLTRIALFSDVLEKKLNDSSKEVYDYIDKIRNNSRSLNNSMRDFLWALDPKKDTVYDVAVLLKDFGEDLFDRMDVVFNVACIQSDLQRYKLDMDWKRNLIMIFKEAMHNTLKHASATKTSLSFSLIENNMKITFLDNGIGFDKRNKTEGYGLTNMDYRTQQMDGNLNIENLSTGGVSVQFIGNLKSFSIK